MTFHDMLAQAVHDLLEQGHFGYGQRVNGNGITCQYLTREGHSCIAGLLFKRYAPTIPLADMVGTVDLIIKHDHPELRGLLASHCGQVDLTDEQLKLLQDMQGMHDSAANWANATDGSMREALALTIDQTVTRAEAKAIYTQVLEATK